MLGLVFALQLSSSIVGLSNLVRGIFAKPSLECLVVLLFVCVSFVVVFLKFLISLVSLEALVVF